MSVESAPLAITDGVDRLFCSRSSARYGPHKRQDEGSVIAPGVLYRYRVLNEADRPLALQLFAGLGRLGGPLWEQEVRVLLRVSAATHPALPRVVDGGYDEAADVADADAEVRDEGVDGDEVREHRRCRALAIHACCVRIGERDRNRFLRDRSRFSSTGRFWVGGVVGDW